MSSTQDTLICPPSIRLTTTQTFIFLTFVSALLRRDQSHLYVHYPASAFESFQLGAGHPTMVGTWSRSFPMPTRLSHYTLLNKDGMKAWVPDGPTQGRCIWEYHDVWRWSKATEKPVILRESYFRRRPDTGKKVGSRLLNGGFAKFFFDRSISMSTFTTHSLSNGANESGD